MAFYSLDQFRRLKEVLTAVHRAYLTAARGIHIPRSVKLSLTAKLAAGAPGSITVGEHTLIAFKTLVYTCDPISGVHSPVSIGSDCFIGGGSVIGPGVCIGNQVIVGAGSVVSEDVPDNCIVVGNPARPIRREVELGQYGVLPVAKENTEQFWRP